MTYDQRQKKTDQKKKQGDNKKTRRPMADQVPVYVVKVPLDMMPIFILARIGLFVPCRRPVTNDRVATVDPPTPFPGVSMLRSSDMPSLTLSPIQRMEMLLGRFVCQDDPCKTYDCPVCMLRQAHDDALRQMEDALSSFAMSAEIGSNVRANRS